MTDEEIIERIKDEPCNFRQHRYVGGPPPRRIYKMQVAHEGRFRKAGLACELVDLRLVYNQHNGICGICSQPVRFEDFSIDHIVPLARGGTHVFGNLQPAHLWCNSKKGDR